MTTAPPRHRQITPARPARHRSRLRTLRRALTVLRSRLQRRWTRHRHLLIANTAYAAALAAGAAALVTQTSALDLLTVLTAGVLAVHRALTHQQTQQDVPETAAATGLPDRIEGDHA